MLRDPLVEPQLLELIPSTSLFALPMFNTYDYVLTCTECSRTLSKQIAKPLKNTADMGQLFVVVSSQLGITIHCFS